MSKNGKKRKLGGAFSKRLTSFLVIACMMMALFPMMPISHAEASASEPFVGVEWSWSGMSVREGWFPERGERRYVFLQEPAGTSFIELAAVANANGIGTMIPRLFGTEGTLNRGVGVRVGNITAPAPTVPTVANATTTSITVVPLSAPMEGWTTEYQIRIHYAGVWSAWQESTTFTNLQPNTSYNIRARFVGDTPVHATTVGVENTTALTTLPDEFEVIVLNDPAHLAPTNQTNSGMHIDGSSVTINAGTLTGWTFTGWVANGVTLADATAREITFTMPNNAVTLTAQWERIELTVTFDENFIGGDLWQETVYHGDTVARPANPTRIGHDFVNWLSGGTEFNFATPITQNTVITAQWQARSYPVTFSYGAQFSADLPANFTATFDSLVTLPTQTPTAYGYTFAGWHEIGHGSRAPGSTFTMPDRAVELVAQWTVNAHVASFDAGVLTTVEGLPEPIGADFGQIITLPSQPPTAIGYTFTGWLTEGFAPIQPGGMFQMPARNVTFVAQWQVNEYIATFTYGVRPNATLIPSNITGNFGTTQTISSIEPESIGHTFTGWSAAGFGTLRAGDTFVMPAGGVTFVANWDRNAYLVDFDRGARTDAMGMPMGFTRDFEEMVTLPMNVPTSEGWTFAGWHAAGIGTLQPGDTFEMPANPVTFVAQWGDQGGNIGVSNSYAVTIANYPAHLNPTNQTVSGSHRFGSNVDLNAGTMQGWTFMGWQANGVTLADASDATATFAMPANAVTLTAQWGDGTTVGVPNPPDEIVITPPGGGDDIVITIPPGSDVEEKDDGTIVITPPGEDAPVITIPPGGDQIIIDPPGTVVTLPPGAEVDIDEDGTVTIRPPGEDAPVITIPPGGGEIIINPPGTVVTIPPGSEVEIDEDGTVTIRPPGEDAPVITIPPGGGEIIVTPPGGEDMVITVPPGTDVEIDEDGTVTIRPPGEDAPVITIPPGGGEIIVTPPGGDDIVITVPPGTDVEIDEDGNVIIRPPGEDAPVVTIPPGGGEIIVTPPGGGDDIVVTIPPGGGVDIDDDGKVTIIPPGGEPPIVVNPTPTPIPTPGGTGGGAGNTPTPEPTATPTPVPTMPPNQPPDIIIPLSPWNQAYLLGYEDGEIRPRGNITRAEVATIFFRLIEDEYRVSVWSTRAGFHDVNTGDWFNNAVSTMVNAGLLQGRDHTWFDPRAPITRAEFATLISRFTDGTAPIATPFNDTAGHWAENYISIASQQGWIVGDHNGDFHPQMPITRAEAATIINRMTNRRLVRASDMLEGATQWVDNADATAWFYLDIQQATNSAVIERNADGSIRWVELLPFFDFTILERPHARAEDIFPARAVWEEQISNR